MAGRRFDENAYQQLQADLKKLEELQAEVTKKYPKGRPSNAFPDSAGAKLLENLAELVLECTKVMAEYKAYLGRAGPWKLPPADATLRPRMRLPAITEELCKMLKECNCHQRFYPCQHHRNPEPSGPQHPLLQPHDARAHFDDQPMRASNLPMRAS
jgi:hypothetical protein